MSPKGGDRDPLFARGWIHRFEEDSSEGAVYRPDGADTPLSRRPRERFELHRGGSARVLTPGPDDRFVERPATWTEEQGEIVIRLGDGSAELRIVDQSPGRLVVQTRRKAHS